MLYIVKKISSNWVGTADYYGTPTSYHAFGYLRTKHFLLNSMKLYYFESPYLNIYTCSVDETWHNTYLRANQYSIAI
jgi:hypothetical protein